MGALASLLAGADVTIILVTDGSESRVPSSVLAEHGWKPEMSAAEQRTLRGRIRLEEAREEAERLGYDRGVVRLLVEQRWFIGHETPPECLHPDLSLREVAGFRPGPIDAAAREEIRSAMVGASICAAPDPNDRLRMHRIVTELVSAARGGAALLTYECLSTVEVTGPQILVGFGEELMERKRRALCAHRSMIERRRQFGGYSNPGTEGYDVIVPRRNAELARRHSLEMPYAERYGWRR